MRGQSKKVKKGTFWIFSGILLLITALVLTGKNLYEDYAAGTHSASILSEMNRLQGDLERADTQDREELPVRGEDRLPEDQLSLPEVTQETERPILPNEVPTFVRHPAVSMPTVSIDAYRYVGTLAFPSLKRTFPIMEEWDYARLKIAPCLFSGSVYQNNAVICGHNYSSHFAPLKHADPGFCAVFTDMSGNQFTYTLLGLDIVQPDDVEKMTESDGNWDLTLFTCTDGGKSRTALRFALKEVSFA